MIINKSSQKIKNNSKFRPTIFLLFMILIGLLFLTNLIPGKLAFAQGNIPTPTPVIIVTNSADPEWMEEPGGIVSFRLEIANQSASSDPVTISVLENDVHGDLNGQGTCSVPQTIKAGEIYSCSYEVYINTSETSLVMVSGTDDESSPVTGSSAISVTVAQAVEDFNSRLLF